MTNLDNEGVSRLGKSLLPLKKWWSPEPPVLWTVVGFGYEARNCSCHLTTMKESKPEDEAPAEQRYERTALMPEGRLTSVKSSLFKPFELRVSVTWYKNDHKIHKEH